MSFCPSRLKAYKADEVLETVDKYKGNEVDTKKARACSNVDDNIPLLVVFCSNNWALGHSIAIKSQCDAPIQKVVPSCKVSEGFCASARKSALWLCLPKMSKWFKSPAAGDHIFNAFSSAYFPPLPTLCWNPWNSCLLNTKPSELVTVTWNVFVPYLWINLTYFWLLIFEGGQRG